MSYWNSNVLFTPSQISTEKAISWTILKYANYAFFIIKVKLRAFFSTDLCSCENPLKAKLLWFLILYCFYEERNVQNLATQPSTLSPQKYTNLLLELFWSDAEEWANKFFNFSNKLAALIFIQIFCIIEIKCFCVKTKTHIFVVTSAHLKFYSHGRKSALKKSYPLDHFVVHDCNNFLIKWSNS